MHDVDGLVWILNVFNYCYLHVSNFYRCAPFAELLQNHQTDDLNLAPQSWYMWRLLVVLASPIFIPFPILYGVLCMDGELWTVSLYRTKSLLSVWIHYTFQGLNIILGEVAVVDINYKDLMIFLKSHWRKLTIQSWMKREQRLGDNEMNPDM